MVRDELQDNKICGKRGSINRIFIIRGDDATEDSCLEKCVYSDECVAMSGIWGSFCIGCKKDLDEPKNGLVAWKSTLLYILSIIETVRNFAVYILT